jgi:hypothetical protein
MAQKCKIPPEVADIMFSLWIAGFTYEEIRRQMAKQGYDYKFKTICALGSRSKWTERRQAIVAATKDYYDDILKASKQKQIRAWALATDALCDQIIKDYLEYKNNPAVFMAEVGAGTRSKPIWMIHTSKDAQVLLETQYMLISDFKKTPDTQINVLNNNLEVQILGDEDRKSLLSLLAEAKERALSGEVIDVEVEKIPEKCP